jgi:anhydro-N-acetylmuramic acid kinase
LDIPFDKNGEIAQKGTACHDSIKKIMENIFFNTSPPKSLDREQIAINFIKKLPVADKLATLVEVIAISLKNEIKNSGLNSPKIIVSGGGSHNCFLMARIAEVCKCTVVTSDKIGMNPDFVEAFAFGYLGVRKMLGYTLSYESTTGNIW